MEFILEMNERGYIEYPLSYVRDKKMNVNDIVPFSFFQHEEKHYFYRGEEHHYFERRKVIAIEQTNGDIQIPNFRNRCILNGNQLIMEKADDMYYNGEQVQRTMQDVHTGDVLMLGDVTIVLHEEWIELYGEIGVHYQSTLLEGQYGEERYPNFPYFNRAPRIIKRSDDEDIKIEQPPVAKNMGAKSIFFTFIPTVAMMAVTIGIGLMIGRGIMLLMSVGTSGVMMIVNTVKYFSDKKENKEYNERRERIYHDYLMRMRKTIYRKYQQNKEAIAYQYPSLEMIDKMIHEYSSRLYERNANDDDFLHLNVGYQSSGTTFHIRVDRKEVEMEKDDLLEEAQLIQKEYEKKIMRPYAVDLKKTHLGIVGSEEVVCEQLNNYMMQLTFLHSYHDLEIIFLHREKHKDVFEHLKWYPHCHIQNSNVRSILYTEQMRDQILGMLYQTLKERKSTQEENKKETRFRPYYIFVIEDADLILNHSIMEYLSSSEKNMDFSILYTTNKAANLPENIATVIQLDDYEHAHVLVDERIYQNTALELVRTSALPLEEEARILSSIVHEETLKSQLPQSINFLEMYGVTRMEELDVIKRWESHHAYKNMAVPLGVKGKDDIVCLDLHEKAHGPHGLIAGTTGSGKSEIVQSYILSLALNFHPDEVGFLLIDYKGGGMANLFQGLPHLLGTITNLDGSETLRAMASIKSELSRRQRVFNHHNVNNINDYHKLFLSGEANEPLPHLMLISDEFAELKKEQPEFMKELVSTARIGRSLGVHLILATQKPSGVVDDQIWSNSKFKLCLKVQNESDSKEILKSADAASITQAGRCYLQVGNNEIYELFQSAWSGAVYQEEQEEEKIDDRIYIINELGQGKLINEDLSEKEQIKVAATQLDVCVEYIHEVYETMEHKEVKRPWLPPLETQIVQPAMAVSETLALNIPIGIVDMPNEQKQVCYEHDFEKDGHLAYFAMSGYGKSMFLQSLVMALAKMNTMKNLHIYLLDFGSGAMHVVNGLAHVADYIKMNEEEKLNKFMMLISEEMETRKELFAAKEVNSLRMYNQMSDEKLKAIVIALDQFDIVKEMGLEIEGWFAKIVRDGAVLGIYLSFSVSQSGTVKYTIMGSIRKRIVGLTSESSEVNSLLGRSEWSMSEIKGRAMVKLDQIYPMQVYSAVGFENELDYVKNIKVEIQKIQEREGVQAERIAVLPKELYYSDLASYPKGKGDILLGLSYNDVEQIGFDAEHSPFVIVGNSQCGKSNAVRMILEQITGNYDTYIIDTKFMEHYRYSERANVHYTSNKEEDVKKWIVNIKEEVQKREELLEDYVRNNPNGNTKTLYKNLEKKFIVIDDYNELKQIFMLHIDYSNILLNAVEVGIRLIVSMDCNAMLSDMLGKQLMSAQQGLCLSPISSLSLLPLAKKIHMNGIDRGVLVKDGSAEKVQLAKMDDSDRIREELS